MTDFKETDIEPTILRLYERIKPFYEQLHAYIRRRLIEVYRNHDMDPRGPIPAHLLGMSIWPLFARFELGYQISSMRHEQLYCSCYSVFYRVNAVCTFWHVIYRYQNVRFMCADCSTSSAIDTDRSDIVRMRVFPFTFRLLTLIISPADHGEGQHCLVSAAKEVMF